MEAIAGLAILIGFPAAFGLTAFYLLNWWRTERHLEHNHPQAWVQLGKPNLMTNNSMAMGLQISRWAKSKEWQQLHDPALNRLMAKRSSLRLAIVVAWAALAVGLVAGVVGT